MPTRIARENSPAGESSVYGINIRECKRRFRNFHDDPRMEFSKNSGMSRTRMPTFSPQW